MPPSVSDNERIYDEAVTWLMKMHAGTDLQLDPQSAMANTQ